LLLPLSCGGEKEHVGTGVERRIADINIATTSSGRRDNDDDDDIVMMYLITVDVGVGRNCLFSEQVIMMARSKRIYMM